MAIGLPVSAFGLSAFAYAIAAAFFRYRDEDDGVPAGSHSAPLNVPAFLAFLGLAGLSVNVLAFFLLTDLTKLKSQALAAQLQTRNERQSIDAAVAEARMSYSIEASQEASDISGVGVRPVGAHERSPLLSFDLNRSEADLYDNGDQDAGLSNAHNEAAVQKISNGSNNTASHATGKAFLRPNHGSMSYSSSTSDLTIQPGMSIESQRLLDIDDEDERGQLEQQQQQRVHRDDGSDDDFHVSCFSSPDAYLLAVIVIAVSGTGLM
jgi:hypothetical protein